MSEQTPIEPPVEEVAEQKPEPAWYDWLVKLVQEFLEFNMISYKKEKNPQLKA